MRLGLTWAASMLLVASSYLTLVIAAPDDAQGVSGLYAVVVFLLALGNLLAERRAR